MRISRLVLTVGMTSLCVASNPLAGCSSDSSSNTGALDAGDGAPPITPEGGATDAEPDTAFGAIGLRVEQVRQHQTDGATDTDLQVSVVLTNGEGGQPVLLNEAYFKLRMESGLMKPPVPSAEFAWVDGKTPSMGDSLAGGAEFGPWRLAFDVDAYSDLPVELVFEVPGASVGDSAIGDGRAANAPVVLEACVSCEEPTGIGTLEPAVCTYLDRDVRHCGGCLVGDGLPFGVYGGESGTCAAGEYQCTEGLSPCATDTGRNDGFSYMGCFDLSSAPLHCGECGTDCQGDACVAGQCAP